MATGLDSDPDLPQMGVIFLEPGSRILAPETPPPAHPFCRVITSLRLGRFGVAAPPLSAKPFGFACRGGVARATPGLVAQLVRARA